MLKHTREIDLSERKERGVKVKEDGENVGTERGRRQEVEKENNKDNKLIIWWTKAVRLNKTSIKDNKVVQGTK